ncbi:MAG: alpha/beta hydrolase [Planctomycetota bacterium]
MVRTVLLPGLGADARLFKPQLDAMPGLEVPDWPDAGPGDTLRTIAERLWTTLDPSGPWVVGGMSFGGQVAMELARLGSERGTAPKAVVLIASCRCADAIPGQFRVAEALGRPVPAGLTRAGLGTLSGLFIQRERLAGDDAEAVRATARDLDIARLKRLARLCAQWTFSRADAQHVVESGTNVVQIHGQRDWVIPLIPAARHDPTEVIPGARHLINLSHADRVNDAIRRSQDAASA